MKFPAIVFSFLILALGATALADDSSDAWADQVDLSPLRLVAVQHDQTMKTLDTFARQAIELITGHTTVDGRDSLFTLLDMSFRPERWVHRNIIKITNVPLRQEFQLLDSIDDNEKQRILHEGTVSLVFLEQQDVLDLLRDVQAQSVNKSKAIDQIMMARDAMSDICSKEAGFIPAAIIPPATSADDDRQWHRLTDMIGDVPELVDVLKKNGSPAPDSPPNYEDRVPILNNIFAASGGLLDGWDKGDPAKINSSAQTLADLLPQINPAVYPSHAKRAAEVIYNRLMKLTIPGAAFYVVAFVLFAMAAGSGLAGLRRWALRMMIAAFAIHTTGIAIRWWLVGDIFPPIKNEFESVMFSAWFGALIGMILEIRFPRGIFGAAASFVGALALVAIFAVPYVTGTQIGGEIAPVQGILMSYWLYIHVTMVTTAYALIAMGFVLSTWWLIRYYSNPRSPGDIIPAAPDGRLSLATLDMCNLVVLQLAFWVLGAGIMLGAIWADQSWGRPWGWDPKETFALVTWIVYLIVVHVRVATVNKGWWTAVLGCFGFFVMLFNWIGVNFLLVGLHSYA
ncbi:MAG: cytochrome c biogenesis protein CcsA [Tepidisphaeraceae bacterium]|jgi:cytochrome c-type biogenesis protein CcsB